MHVILLMKLKWTKIHTVVLKRDPVRQGHVTLSVIFHNSGSSEARAMIFLRFVNFWGRGYQININPHCNYQA